MIPGFRGKPLSHQYISQLQHQRHSAAWPLQDRFVIPDDDEPPSLEARTPTPRKTYPFMSKGAEKMQQWHRGRAFYGGWDGDYHHHHHHLQHQHQHQHQYQSSSPHTYYEQNYEKTNDIVFWGSSGAGLET